MNFLRNMEYETVTDSHCNQEVWLGSITCACILGAAVFAGEARETVTMFQFLRCVSRIMNQMMMTCGVSRIIKQTIRMRNRRNRRKNVLETQSLPLL